MASSTAPEASSAAITASVMTAISTAIVLAAAIATAAGARRVILRGIVLGRKILRRGSVRIGLAFVFFGGVGFVVRFDRVPFRQLIAWSWLLHDTGLFIVSERLVVRRIVLGRLVMRRFVALFVEVNDVLACFAMSSGVRERFTGKHFDDVRRRGRIRWRSRHRRIGVPVSVIIVLEIFEDVADVQEGIAIEADIHERRLHAGEDAGDFAFVDAADEREFFFALDVNFD
jgi:hypothetical protein